jgi:hypothetical protein
VTRPDAALRVINHLRRELAATRLQYANLLAAARAALAAAHDGDPYALEFLADELVAQHGQADLDAMTFEPTRADEAALWWEVRR